MDVGDLGAKAEATASQPKLTINAMQSLTSPGTSEYGRFFAFSSGNPGTLYGPIVAGETTLSANVPTSGSASLNGYIRGTAIENQAYNFVTGTLALNMDFATTTLSGTISPEICSCASPWDYGGGGFDLVLPTYAIAGVSFSGDRTHFSGTIATNVSGGLNLFDGVFVGPNAGEAIGRLALPYDTAGHAGQIHAVWSAR